MNELKAQALADKYNLEIGAETTTAKFKVFAYWLPNYEKVYNVVLIPTIYESDFDAATESLKIAFQRVSVKATALSADALSQFVNNFQTKGAEDSELAPYLGL